jgi:hypothetical protein
MIRRITCLLLALSFSAPVSSPQPKKRKILAIGDVHRKIFQHDVVSHALATIEHLGYQSKIFDTYIRTDIQPITKHPIRFAETTAVPDANGKTENYLTLNDFDAIVFFGLGELELTNEQKADMMSFIKEDGKGFVGIRGSGQAKASAGRGPRNDPDLASKPRLEAVARKQCGA